MSARTQLLRLTMLSALVLPAVATAGSVEVFTLATLPPIAVPAGTIVYELDAQARLEERLSRDLPGDPEAATRIADERIKAGGVALQQELVRAGTGLSRAIALGINRVPAIVIDGRWVAYGETDVAKALSTAVALRSRSQGRAQ